MNIPVTTISKSGISGVDFKNLPFGKIFSDHMFTVDYKNGEWQNAQIVPFGDLCFKPSLSALHHAQNIFEGMKVYKNPQGEVLFFRAIDNFHRLNKSAHRMCMPPVPEDVFMSGLKALIDIDRDWIPTDEGTSLYIRPVYFATDEAIGVKPSETYKLVIFTSPSGPYFNKPLNVLVEQHFSRSAEGGTGYAKAAGNYGGAMYPTKLGQEKGFDQLIWTDAVENRFVEESGAMNLMFMFGDVLVTPALSHSKLAGITRDSILQVAKSWNVRVEERNVSVDEIFDQYSKGNLVDAFGCGTAANIIHIGSITWNDKKMVLPPPANRDLSNRLYAYLNRYRLGQEKDSFGWLTKLEQKQHA